MEGTQALVLRSNDGVVVKIEGNPLVIQELHAIIIAEELFDESTSSPSGAFVFVFHLSRYVNSYFDVWKQLVA